MPRKGRFFLWMVWVWLAWLAPGQAGAQPGREPSQPQRVNVENASLLQYQQRGGAVVQRLVGEVELSQDSVFMYCDSALIEQSNQVFALGNVIIQQGDSISAFADTLYYNGDLKEADLLGRVVLVNGSQRLYTNRLHYDLNTKLATYTSGATLTNDSTQLSSRRGYYYADTETAYFKDSVVVVDPRFQLRADTLMFDAKARRVNFLGPTVMRTDSSRVYCEDGFFDTENNVAEFRRNAQYQNNQQKATADVIRYDGNNAIYVLDGNARFSEGERVATADLLRYDQRNDRTELRGNARVQDKNRTIVATDIDYDGARETYATRGRSLISDPPQLLEADAVAYQEAVGMGLATGNVIWRDTSQRLTITCDTAGYRQETGFLQASGGSRGRPLLIAEIDGDSLFMTADTLLSMRLDTSQEATDDSSRLLLAYRDVRIFKSDLQALADSLAYSSFDETFRFFRAPLIWSDTSQFSADTIHLRLRDEQLDRIFLYLDAFIVNSPDEVFFNQIKGRNIVAWFDSTELRRMQVTGNAESVYYAQDDAGAYVGVNKTVCSEMNIGFGNNQVTEIVFYTQPQGRLDPMGAVDHEAIRLKGYNWQPNLRPKSLDDLFGPPPRTVSRTAQASGPPQRGESAPSSRPAPIEQDQ